MPGLSRSAWRVNERSLCKTIQEEFLRLSILESRSGCHFNCGGADASRAQRLLDLSAYRRRDRPHACPPDHRIHDLYQRRPTGGLFLLAGIASFSGYLQDRQFLAHGFSLWFMHHRVLRLGLGLSASIEAGSSFCQPGAAGHGLDGQQQLVHAAAGLRFFALWTDPVHSGALAEREEPPFVATASSGNLMGEPARFIHSVVPFTGHCPGLWRGQPQGNPSGSGALPGRDLAQPLRLSALDELAGDGRQQPDQPLQRGVAAAGQRGLAVEPLICILIGHGFYSRVYHRAGQTFLVDPLSGLWMDGALKRALRDLVLGDRGLAAGAAGCPLADALHRPFHALPAPWIQPYPGDFDPRFLLGLPSRPSAAVVAAGSG